MPSHERPNFIHPVDSGRQGGNHGSSIGMLADIDRVCVAEGVYPHAVLSAHSHNYQRFTRQITFAGQRRAVPFVVCDNGGHNVNPLVRGTRGSPAVEPENGTDVSYLDHGTEVVRQSLKLER